MFINIHCELVDDQSRILRIRGEDLLDLNLDTFEKLNTFLKLDFTKMNYIDTFSQRYNTKKEYMRYSKFQAKGEWEESFDEVLNVFYSSISERIHK